VRCESFETRLNELIDEHAQPAADAALASHASQCAACEKLLRDYASLLSGVAAMPCPEVPAGLSLRVVADWRAAPRRAVQRRRTFVMMAMAAALLVAAIPTIAWLLRTPAGETQQGSQLAVVEETPATESSAAENSATDLALVDQAREAYEPLINATNESLASVWSALPSTFATDTAPSDAATPDDVVFDNAVLDDAVLDQELADSLRPVAVSASRSVAALLRVLPGTARALDERGISQ
jgi:hypothetical protein